MAGRPRTRLADRLVAEALELLHDTGRPVFPDVLLAVLARDAQTPLELEAAQIALRRLYRHPLVVVSAEGLLAHRVLTNGREAHG